MSLVPYVAGTVASVGEAEALNAFEIIERAIAKPSSITSSQLQRAGGIVKESARLFKNVISRAEPKVSYDPFAKQSRGPTPISSKPRLAAVQATKATSKPAMKMALVAKGVKIRNAGPRITGSPYSADGSIVVVHREYFGDLTSSSSGIWKSQNYNINPANPSLFPWLSQLAVNFEQFTIEKLHVAYETSCSTSNAGSVMIAVDYDPGDEIPQSKVELMAIPGAVRSPLWQETIFKADNRLLNRGLVHFIMGSAQDTTSSAYDANTSCGSLVVATIGAAITQPGDLYIDYKIKLSGPQRVGGGAPASLSAALSFTPSSRTVPFNAVLVSQPQLSGWAKLNGNTLVTPVAGEWMVSVIAGGTVFTAVAPTLVVNGTVTAISVLQYGFTYSGATYGYCEFRLVTNGNVADGFAVDFTPMCTTLTSLQIQINPYSYDLAF